MANILEYKGYRASVEFDADKYLLKGKVLRINENITFESDTIPELKEKFHIALDDYLKKCEEEGKAPEREYKGTFNVRITPELHGRLAMLASENGDSLNATVEKAIFKYVNENCN